MATTKTQDYFLKQSDSIGKAYQLLKERLGDGSGISSPATISDVLARISTRTFAPEHGSYGVSSLSGELDLEELTLQYGPFCNYLTETNWRNIEESSITKVTDHLIAKLFEKPVRGLAETIGKLVSNEHAAVAYTWATLCAGATEAASFDAYADRIFLCPEFALLARSLGLTIPGQCVRAPVSEYALQITMPGTIDGAVTPIKNGTDSAVVTAKPAGSLAGIGDTKNWVGLQMQIVNLSGSSISLSTSAPDLTLYFKDESGTDRSVTFGLGTSSWANGAAKDGPTVDANSKIFAAWRTDANGNAGSIDPKNSGNGDALEGAVLGIRFKDVALTA